MLGLRFFSLISLSQGLMILQRHGGLLLSFSFLKMFLHLFSHVLLVSSQQIWDLFVPAYIYTVFG